LRLLINAKPTALKLENAGQGPQTVQDFTLRFTKRVETNILKMGSKEVLKPVIGRMHKSRENS